MIQLDRDDLTRVAKEALYATVGFGVLTVQQLDSFRRQVAERLTSQPRINQRLISQLGVGREQLDTLVQAVEAQLRSVDERVKLLETRVDGVLDDVQSRLPEPAADVLARTRKAATDAYKAAAEAGDKLTGLVRDAA